MFDSKKPYRISEEIIVFSEFLPYILEEIKGESEATKTERKLIAKGDSIKTHPEGLKVEGGWGNIIFSTDWIEKTIAKHFKTNVENVSKFKIPYGGNDAFEIEIKKNL